MNSKRKQYKIYKLKMTNVDQIYCMYMEFKQEKSTFKVIMIGNNFKFPTKSCSC